MSMFQITGQIVNVYYQPGPVDKETGEIKPGKKRVQIMGEIPVSEEDNKFDIVDLSVKNGLDFERFKGKKVSVDLGIFSPTKGVITYYIPKGAKIHPHEPLA